jgi:hypothetical protein
MGCPAELFLPLSNSRKFPRVASANAGEAFIPGLKPKCFE